MLRGRCKSHLRVMKISPIPFDTFPPYFDITFPLEISLFGGRDNIIPRNYFKYGHMILCHIPSVEISKVNDKDVNDLIDYSSLQVPNKPLYAKLFGSRDFK